MREVMEYRCGSMFAKRCVSVAVNYTPAHPGTFSPLLLHQSITRGHDGPSLVIRGNQRVPLFQYDVWYSVVGEVGFAFGLRFCV